MIMLTTPIKFESVAAMNSWYGDFNLKGMEICIKNNVHALWDRVLVSMDETTCEFGIVSMGTYAPNSNEEKAIKEILHLVNPNFST